MAEKTTFESRLLKRKMQMYKNLKKRWLGCLRQNLSLFK